MEAFKELERESKTKAFSKAGLARGTAETPEEVSIKPAWQVHSTVCKCTAHEFVAEGAPRRV